MAAATSPHSKEIRAALLKRRKMENDVTLSIFPVSRLAFEDPTMSSNNTSTTALKQHIEAALEAERPSSAVPLLECLVRLSNEEPEDLLRLGKALYLANQYDSAFGNAKKVIDQVQSEIDYSHENDNGSFANSRRHILSQATALAMKCCMARGDHNQATMYAQRILHTSPASSVEANLVLASCARSNGNAAAAALRYKMALEADPLCAAAFDPLCSQFLVPRSDLGNFIASLRFPDGTEAIRETYMAKLSLEGSRASPSPALPKPIVLYRQALADYRFRDLLTAAQKTSQLFEANPFQVDACCLHLAILVERHETAKLYEVGHRLVGERPQHPLSLYAIGCYYYAQHEYEKAGRFFSKATELEPGTLPAAHVALGHCYARLEEAEAALGVYRNAQHLFPGLYICQVYQAMQYCKGQNYQLAMCCAETTRKIAPKDPIVWNEIGVIYFKSRDNMKAKSCFEEALRCLPDVLNPGEYHSSIFFNLATVLRRLEDYSNAVLRYEEYLQHHPDSPQGHCGLGLTYHLSGNLQAAIDHYHRSLAIKNEVFTRDLLDRALSEEYSKDLSTWTGDAGGMGSHPSPSPGGIAFSTISRASRSESAQPHYDGQSPQPVVGRSLF